MLPVAERNKRCFPISVAPDDPVFSIAGKQCLNLFRTFTDADLQCPGSKIENPNQINQATSFFDLSPIYGNSLAQNQILREFQDGRLLEDNRHGTNWPPHSPVSDKFCDIESDTEVCYKTGDVRANQQPSIASIQVIFLREHNRIAAIFKQLNPTWNDERIFQETRQIIIALYQKICYYEWLPWFVGNMFGSFAIIKECI